MSVMERIGPDGEVRIKADGAKLIGRLVLPTGPLRAAVVLHGATGVPAGYYKAFAEWMAAERGCAVLTYDYRDFGKSALGPMSNAKAKMSDWGLRDQAAALEALGGLVPGAPRWVIGHSLGGLWLGFHSAMLGVKRVIAVASGPIHVSDHPFLFRIKAQLFWRGPVPFVSRRLGYVPGRLLGFGADLPLGVYEDWRRWSLNRGFHLSDSDESRAVLDASRVTAAMRVVAVEDDAWIPKAAAWRLMTLYPEAMKSQLVLRPADFGLTQIGHLGAFHRSNAVVWPALVD